jgi:hypothetical protein
LQKETRELTSNLKPLGLDVFNDLHSSLGDERHIFSVAIFAKEARRADDNIHTVYTCLYGQPGILHIAADIWQMIRREASHETRVMVTHESKSWPWVGVSPTPRITRQIEKRTFRPSLQISSQSLRDCSDAAGDVTSM